MRTNLYSNRHILQALKDSNGDPAKLKQLFSKHPDAVRDLGKILNNPDFRRGPAGQPSLVEKNLATLGRKGMLDPLYNNWNNLSQAYAKGDWYHKNKPAADQMLAFKNANPLSNFWTFLTDSAENNQQFLRSMYEMNSNPNSGWRKHFGDSVTKESMNGVRPYLWLLQLISNLKGTLFGNKGWAATNYNFNWKNGPQGTQVATTATNTAPKVS